ncbi:RNA-binding transcriptional accessory protein [Termitidicoccus mucosus]|uniref:RNA-binding transcriptional accessory protein n=1 Tax=Termitidicoccus mucosus TaxID=1184151 RepID=A0A178ICU0_9BACT|nr:RNA-binding transcriptional accessory protein [Opitutaceae bacterium TSB47]
MSTPNPDHVLRITQELGLKVHQVATTAQLLAEGATVPFIARYRKEATGELDEVQITAIRDRSEQLAALDERRASITASLKERNLLTDDLAKKIAAAETLNALEDIYLPFRPKKRTRATIAREKGLEPLADLILAQDPAADPAAEAAAYVNREYTPDDGKNTPQTIASADEALAGARDIIAERISDDAPTRAKLRALSQGTAVISSKVISGKETEGAKFKDYFEWSEPLAKAPSHRVLAMRRGEKELVLMMRITVDETAALAEIEPLHVKSATQRSAGMAGMSLRSEPARDFADKNVRAPVPPAVENTCAHHVRLAVADAYKRLLAPAMETEMRLETKKRADETAIKVFAENLRELLLASPLGQKNTLAIDPGFRTGCKVVILDRQGKLLHNDVVYPEQGASRSDEAREKIAGFITFFKIEAIAIGNGTAGRETEAFIRSLDLPKSIPVVMVNESGASIYSASEVAREEFPDHDITVRGAVSIGRRLMDPLAELVKLDPKSIGVGQYQHDVDQNALKRSLDDTVVSSVNAVGVEVNTASKQLLSYVSGLNSSIAANIVAHRNENGPFKSRAELLGVSRLGPKAYEQAAGFLRIRDAGNPLDASAVHPESYAIVEKMAADLGVTVADLVRDEKARRKIKLEAYVTDTVGLPTLNDILAELAKPGRDPRQKFEAFAFADGVNKPEDLKPGMKLPGIVTNVTAFGAFVDIGVHQDGLVHVSQLADAFVKDPAEIVKVSQRVTVTVTEVDLARGRIALSMRSKPELGAKTGQRAAPGAGGFRGGQRPGGNGFGGAAPRRDSGQSLGGDWFTAALNKKK